MLSASQWRHHEDLAGLGRWQVCYSQKYYNMIHFYNIDFKICIVILFLNIAFLFICCNNFELTVFLRQNAGSVIDFDNILFN